MYISGTVWIRVGNSTTDLETHILWLPQHGIMLTRSHNVEGHRYCCVGLPYRTQRETPLVPKPNPTIPGIMDITLPISTSPNGIIPNLNGCPHLTGHTAAGDWATQGPSTDLRGPWFSHCIARYIGIGHCVSVLTDKIYIWLVTFVFFVNSSCNWALTRSEARTIHVNPQQMFQAYRRCRFE